MVMTLCTFHSDAEDSLTEGVCFIEHVFYSVFFFNNSSFLGVFMVSIKGCRQKLLLGWIGEDLLQVAKSKIDRSVDFY